MKCLQQLFNSIQLRITICSYLLWSLFMLIKQYYTYFTYQLKALVIVYFETEPIENFSQFHIQKKVLYGNPLKKLVTFLKKNTVDVITKHIKVDVFADFLYKLMVSYFTSSQYMQLMLSFLLSGTMQGNFLLRLIKIQLNSF